MIENAGLTPVEEAENITLTYICVRRGGFLPV